MHDFIINMVNKFGYFGVFLLIAIENLFPPIPSELILTFGGFMSAVSALSFWGVVFFATMGSVAGAIVLYGLGRILKPEKLERFFQSKCGRMLHLRKSDVKRAGGWFQRHGNLAVFLGRFIPLVRSLISIPAGIAKMNIGLFIVLTTIGTLIWNLVLIYLGKLAGAAYESVLAYVGYFSWFLISILFLVGAFFAARFIKRRFLSDKTPKQTKSDEK